MTKCFLLLYDAIRFFILKTMRLTKYIVFYCTLIFLTSQIFARESSDILLRFIVAGDSHWGQINEPYKDQLNNFIKSVNSISDLQQIDYIIINGDIVNDDLSLFPSVLDQLKTLSPPYILVPGNHDFVNDTEWMEITGNPLNHEKKIDDDFLFLLVNSSDKESGVKKGMPSSHWVCADSQFIHDAVSRNKERKVFIFIHIPQYPWVDASVYCPDIMDTISNSENVLGTYFSHAHDATQIYEYKDKIYTFTGRIGGSGTTEPQYKIITVLKNYDVKIDRVTKLDTTFPKIETVYLSNRR